MANAKKKETVAQAQVPAKKRRKIYLCYEILDVFATKKLGATKIKDLAEVLRTEGIYLDKGLSRLRKHCEEMVEFGMLERTALDTYKSNVKNYSREKAKEQYDLAWNQKHKRKA